MSHIVVHPRILMVDNDKRAIEALTALLSKALPNAYVADDVTDGTKALSLCRAYGNQYDIILLDMSLEGLQGPDICKRIRLINNRTPILAMTSFSLNRYRNSAIESGAQGLVDKSSSEQFTQYIPRIVRGQTVSKPRSSPIYSSKTGPRSSRPSPSHRKPSCTCAPKNT